MDYDKFLKLLNSEGDGNSGGFEERRKLMNAIMDRAERLKLLDHDRVTLFMDLRLVDSQVGLQLQEFLDADETDFIHDICGIQRHFNRQTLSMEDFFSPRFSSRKPKSTEL